MLDAESAIREATAIGARVCVSQVILDPEEVAALTITTVLLQIAHELERIADNLDRKEKKC